MVLCPEHDSQVPPSFHPIVFIVFHVLIQEGFALRRFLDYNELNIKRQFTITTDFVT
jgi:hypothetical protein